MTFGVLFRRPGARALCALLALVGVLWLNAVPHHHSDDRGERHCATCQVARGDGQAPAERTHVLAPPSAGSAPITSAIPVPVATGRHDGPPPGRSPPFPLS